MLESYTNVVERVVECLSPSQDDMPMEIENCSVSNFCNETPDSFPLTLKHIELFLLKKYIKCLNHILDHWLRIFPI